MFTNICEGIQTIGLAWAWPLTFMLLVWCVHKTIQKEMSMTWMARQKERESTMYVDEDE